MGKYTVEPTTHFTEILTQLEAKNERIKESVSVAVGYLENFADRCGISSNRGQKYFVTRSIPDLPSYVLFFYLDENTNVVNLTTISENPRNPTGE